jgi:hypothetical protein
MEILGTGADKPLTDEYVKHMILPADEIATKAPDT